MNSGATPVPFQNDYYTLFTSALKSHIQRFVSHYVCAKYFFFDKCENSAGQNEHDNEDLPAPGLEISI